MKEVERQRLRDQIRAAFPPEAFYGPVTTCTCDECTEIRNSLTHKRWDEIPASFLDHTCSPTLLDPEAFQSFLPAYLLRALHDPTDRNRVLEFTVYCLSPRWLSIPAKPITDSCGKPITVWPAGSERSDAGVLMMPEVIGIVKSGRQSEPQATLRKRVLRAREG